MVEENCLHFLCSLFFGWLMQRVLLVEKEKNELIFLNIEDFNLLCDGLECGTPLCRERNPLTAHTHP